MRDILHLQGNPKKRQQRRGNTYIRSHGLVDRSPPDIVLGGLLLDDTLIGRRATSLSSRVGSQGTAGGDSSTSLVDQSIFVESRDSRVGNLS